MKLVQFTFEMMGIQNKDHKLKQLSTPAVSIPGYTPVLTHSKRLITFSHCSFHEIIIFENCSVESMTEGCCELLQTCGIGANQVRYGALVE
jgi:hypothetical protein